MKRDICVRNTRNGIYIRKTVCTLLIVFIAWITASCRRTPKTDYITNKEGQSSLISDHTQADNGILIKNQCNAPEHADAESDRTNEYTTIKIHADVDIPEQTKVPIYQFAPKHYTNDELESLVTAVLSDSVDGYWEWSNVSYTEEELYEWVEYYQHIVDTMKVTDVEQPVYDSDRYYIIEGNEEVYENMKRGVEQYKAYIEDLQSNKDSKQTGVVYEYHQEENLIKDGILIIDGWNGDITPQMIDEEMSENGGYSSYQYQTLALRGKRNGMDSVIRISDDSRNVLIQYTLNDSQITKYGSPFEAYFFHHQYHTGYNHNQCIYSVEEAEGLIRDMLKDMGFGEYQAGYVYDLDTTDTRKNTMLGFNGYTFFMYRAYDDMSDTYYNSLDTDILYGPHQVPLQDRNPFAQLMSGDEMLAVAGDTSKVRLRRETICATVTDDGVVKLTILNPFVEQEQLTENVELLDFEQVLSQGMTAMEMKYADSGTYSNRTSIEIKKIQLNYAYMQAPDNPNEYTMIPVWDFRSGKDGNIYVTINAIDGTEFNRLTGH